MRKGRGKRTPIMYQCLICIFAVVMENFVGLYGHASTSVGVGGGTVVRWFDIRDIQVRSLVPAISTGCPRVLGVKKRPAFSVFAGTCTYVTTVTTCRCSC